MIRHWLGALALMMNTAAPQAAQPFPSQPIRLIVTTSPGTGSDTIARMLESGMSQALGKPVIVENRPGAGGALGMDLVARADPDGHTIVLGANGTMIAVPAMNPDVIKYRMTDFAPVAGLLRAPFVIVTANDERAPKNVGELVERTRGEPPSYGSSGIGTITHLASEMFLFRTGGKAVHVPYRGSNQSLADVIAGNVLFVSDTLPAALPLIRGGKLRALAVTTDKRVPNLPDVPTLIESGYPDLVASGWWGLLAPAGTPPDVVKKLNAAALQAMQTPEARKRIEALELKVMGQSPDAFAAFIKKEGPVWTDLITKANIRSE